MEDVDWRISILQYAMDEATHRLAQPGLSFSKLEPSGPILISKAFEFPLVGALQPPHNSYSPDSDFQGLFSLGRGLNDVIEER
jgi:hypothetical protein